REDGRGAQAWPHEVAGLPAGGVGRWICRSRFGCRGGLKTSFEDRAGDRQKVRERRSPLPSPDGPTSGMSRSSGFSFLGGGTFGAGSPGGVGGRLLRLTTVRPTPRPNAAPKVTSLRKCVSAASREAATNVSSA